MASSFRTGKETIHGLREQILANATIVFEKVVRDHYETFPDSSVQPKDLFDVVLTELDGDHRFDYKAILVYGRQGYSHDVVAVGAAKAGMDAALESLLILLGSLTDPKQMLHPMGTEWKLPDGVVDKDCL